MKVLTNGVEGCLGYLGAVERLVGAGDDEVVRASDVRAAPAPSAIRKPCIVYGRCDGTGIACCRVVLVEPLEDDIVCASIQKINVDFVGLGKLRSSTVPCEA